MLLPGTVGRRAELGGDVGAGTVDVLPQACPQFTVQVGDIARHALFGLLDALGGEVAQVDLVDVTGTAARTVDHQDVVGIVGQGVEHRGVGQCLLELFIATGGARRRDRLLPLLAFDVGDEELADEGLGHPVGAQVVGLPQHDGQLSVLDERHALELHAVGADHGGWLVQCIGPPNHDHALLAIGAKAGDVFSVW